MTPTLLKRLALSLLLAFFLLFAQQGAMRHAVSHLSERLNPSSQEKQLPHQAACDLCGTYADLNGAAAASGFKLPSASPVIQGNLLSRTDITTQAPRAFFARAPPSFA